MRKCTKKTWISVICAAVVLITAVPAQAFKLGETPVPETATPQKEKVTAESQPETEVSTIGSEVSNALPQEAETASETEETDAAVRDIEALRTGGLAEMNASAPMELLSAAQADALNEAMQSYVAGEESLLQNKADSYYYYERLDPTAKNLYDVMYEVCRDPANEGNIGLIMTDIDPESDRYYDAFNLAYRAICFDHPELFWLYSGEQANIVYGSEAAESGGLYLVYVWMESPFTEFTTQMTAFNTAAADFLAEIDTSASEYEIVREIHDKLIALVDYDDPVAAGRTTLQGQDLAHTAYGCLVEDSSGNANKAVCDGYSLAFEYLLQQCGIQSMLLCGMGGASEETAGGHAWNMVQVDGEWYEVDATWNDAGNSEDIFEVGTLDYQYMQEMLSDRDYRDMLEHYLFLVSTETMRHFVPTQDQVYITQDQLYVLSVPQESVHIRMDEEHDSYGYDTQLMSTAPTADRGY